MRNRGADCDKLNCCNWRSETGYRRGRRRRPIGGARKDQQAVLGMIAATASLLVVSPSVEMLPTPVKPDGIQH